MERLNLPLLAVDYYTRNHWEQTNKKFIIVYKRHDQARDIPNVTLQFYTQANMQPNKN